MFTIEQIKDAQKKIKTGADFPAYARDLKALGLEGYHSYVSDGRVIYYGTDGYFLDGGAIYPELPVAEIINGGSFKERLKAHQQGQSTYPEFVQDCASAGVEKWEVDLKKMTCTYFDRFGGTMLEEAIPSPS